MNQNYSTTGSQDTSKAMSAIEIANGGGVHWNGNGEFFVESTQQAGMFFQVTKAKQMHNWTCTCRDYQAHDGLCVHVLAAYKCCDKARMQSKAGAR